MQNKITQAIILAAGLGTRLRPLTDNIPKVMVPLGGKPLLQWHVENLKECGVKEFFINLHYLPEKITDYFGGGSKFGVKINYVLEKPEILGTAGGVKNFECMLADNFFVIYGDTFYKINYEHVVDFYLSHKDAIGAGTVRKTDHPWDSDLAVVDDGGRVVEFHIKPHKELPQNYFGMSAPYIFSKKILDYIPAGKYYEIDHNLVPDILGHGYKYYAYRLGDDEFRKDIGTMERYNAVQEYLKKNKATSS
jgi:NDP-sugar pyrophosphorylase family protein